MALVLRNRMLVRPHFALLALILLPSGCATRDPALHTTRLTEEALERAPIEPAPTTASGEWLSGPSVAAELLFASGSAALSAESKRALDDVAARLTGRHDYRLELVGHADGAGEAAENRLLAAERAEAVRRYLGEVRRIPLERIAIRSLGESAPAADESTAAGQARNRRVIVLLGASPE